MDLLRAEEQHAAIWNKWLSQYMTLSGHHTFGTFPRERALEPLDSPHLDLVVEYSRRALAAKLGEPLLLLQGPDNHLYAATLFKSRPKGGGRPASWRERSRVRRADANLIRDGRPATVLTLHSGHHDDRDYVRASWYVDVNDDDYRLYSPGMGGSTWGSRTLFAKACASALRNV